MSNRPQFSGSKKSVFLRVDVLDHNSQVTMDRIRIQITCFPIERFRAPGDQSSRVGHDLGTILCVHGVAGDES